MVIFQWIGIAVCAAFAFLSVAFMMLKLYFTLLHGRFGLIFFRPSQRRISIASWHSTKLKPNGLDDPEPDVFGFDDWPVNKRPFYLSYEIGRRRIFILTGMLEGLSLQCWQGEASHHPTGGRK
jgi:predicted membrane-bound dolichyl-phosphate-mannose-protein mannosyltransferase